MDDFAGRVAVVTGAGSGIGASLARIFAKNGMKVMVADIDESSAQLVAERLCAEGYEASYDVLDVTNKTAMLALADKAWKRYGGCHILCNNAGVSVVRPLIQTSEEDWNWMLSVNLMGVVHGLAAFVPRMLALGEPGHIVNVSSMAGIVPLKNFGAYVASKYAVVGLSEVLQLELSGQGLDVSVVCPGWVATRIQDSRRNRPELHDADGGNAADVVPSFPPELAEVIAPEKVAAQVLHAIRHRKFYVGTHPAWRQAFERRSLCILEALQESGLV